MSGPKRKKATSARHAKAKRAARRARKKAVRGVARRTSKAAAGGASKRAAKRPAGRKAARPAKKVRGRGAKRAAQEPARRPPTLRIVTRPATPPPVETPAEVTEFAGAKSDASAKDLALFEMERAHVAVHAAIQGLTAGAANQPIAPGKWTPRQIVLHLAFWDREVLSRYLEPAVALGQRAGVRRSELDHTNAAGLAALEHHDWESAKRLLQISRENLWDALESIPAEPAEVWSRQHAVGELVYELTKHDRHHAEILKRFRAGTS